MATEVYKILDFPEDTQFISLFYECSICFEKTGDVFTPKHGCKAYFCKECYKGWMESAIRDTATTVICPNGKCKQTLDNDSEVLPFVGEKERELLLKNMNDVFLANIPGFMFCSTKNCQNGFIANPDDSFVTCPKCEKRSCVSCKNEYHVGLTCEQYKAFLASKDDGFRQSEEFLKSKCKNCPKCSAPIQKDAGCDHMTCTRCKNQFCWICLKPYYNGHLAQEHPRQIQPVRVTPEYRELLRGQLVDVLNLEKRRTSGDKEVTEQMVSVAKAQVMLALNRVNLRPMDLLRRTGNNQTTTTTTQPVNTPVTILGTITPIPPPMPLPTSLTTVMPPSIPANAVMASIVTRAIPQTIPDNAVMASAMTPAIPVPTPEILLGKRKQRSRSKSTPRKNPKVVPF